MPSDSSEYLAGGLDIGGPQGGRRRVERPARIEFEDPPGEFEQESVCSTCGARLFRSTARCQTPGAGVCPLSFRRRQS